MRDETTALPQDFWDRRDWLRRIWHEHQELWGALDYDDQRALHDYYAPAKDLSGAELDRWLVALHAKLSSHPERAVTAYERFRTVHAEAEAVGVNQAGLYCVKPATYVEAQRGGRTRRVGVSPIAAPELDVQKMALALIELARQQLKDEAEARSNGGGASSGANDP